jgi:hypothetical protein
MATADRGVVVEQHGARLTGVAPPMLGTMAYADDGVRNGYPRDATDGDRG